ncbi:beta-lactamase/transpeptidase-like protein [Mycena metata]|uniref:Beta-lactamase/transpeptidase-like protein n=1 Tax=Mycena metata TaxID=1033252 RepID=A0AAD7IS17_9AGAR|nr:beta-lactamase/transpeptidase-like protein [Mycena metata]
MLPIPLLALLPCAYAYQVPLLPPKRSFLTPKIDAYITSQLSQWNSSGLAVAVVKQEEGSWNVEFGSYGQAQATGAPVTPDTVFAIASDSKLFLSMAVGLLIKNESLAAQRGEKLRWDTKIATLLPEWGLMDPEMERGVTIQDMLSHRTGLPPHDYSGYAREGGVPEMISTLRFLRPASALREHYQYNNLMYETLSHLLPTLLDQSFESYIAEHIFTPLGMNASTYSVAEAEARGTLAHGFHWSMKDLLVGRNGSLTATVPYFQRPGEEKIWAGAAGILTSARDLSVWVSMLLNEGRHPVTNVTIIPADVVEHVALGVSVSLKKAEFPETSPKVYGCGQNRFSYRAHEIIEHGGSNPGFKTIVSRLPHDNIGLVVLSNDDNGVRVMEPVKFQIIDTLLGLEPINWSQRYIDSIAKGVRDNQAVTSRPAHPIPPTSPFSAMEGTFTHGAYGTLSPCYVRTSGLSVPCTAALAHPVVQTILNASTPDIPTLIVPFKRTFSTHLRLVHFSANLFNASVIWSNYDVRRAEVHTLGGDVLVGLDNRFTAEWVAGEKGRAGDGWAFKGEFWGRDGDVRELEGVGEASAEVWFGRTE